ncbi:MAG: hypothetical protein PVJ36_05565 [Nitrospirota bacterium]|jgi:hypothetical protein
MDREEEGAALAGDFLGPGARASFFEATRELRRELLLRRAQYQEAARDPGTPPARLLALARGIQRLERRIMHCWPERDVP